MEKYDIVGGIMDYEAGEMDCESMKILFSHLIASGQVIQLYDTKILKKESKKVILNSGGWK